MKMGASPVDRKWTDESVEMCLSLNPPSACVCCSTAIAIRCKDGVVFGVEKLVLSKLYEEGSNKRIFNVDRHVGMVTTHPRLL